MKEKLEEDKIKWYVNIYCVFKKPKKEDVTGAPTDEFHTEDVDQRRKSIRTILSKPKLLKMTTEDTKKFQDATYCSICHKELGARRVRDHDHVSGLVRGAAHNCNLKYRLLKR